MILLRANAELQKTFERVIDAMQVPVQWNGIFAVIDNYIILQGEVRSLFFHFDSRRVVTNLIDIPVQEEAVEPVGTNMRVQNAVNMILYAFGKWGNIKGLRVDKGYEELNRLFAGIMREYEVEPEYTREYFRFYRGNMRITYEDVVQLAVEYREEDAAETEDEEETPGLWRKIIWKRQAAEFVRTDLAEEKRRGERLGNNFYMVGYLCPVCRKNLHMVVYPPGNEFRIETEEGAVILARAAACDSCRSFYTPRPRKLFAEGDIYCMEFGEDRRAYEDYLELLGRNGARVSNSSCNEFADKSRYDAEETGDSKSLEELVQDLPELPDIEVQKLMARMEEGFYPEESRRRAEGEIRAQERDRIKGRERAAAGENGAKTERQTAGQQAAAFRPAGGAVSGADGSYRHEASAGKSAGDGHEASAGRSGGNRYEASAGKSAEDRSAGVSLGPREAAEDRRDARDAAGAAGGSGARNRGGGASSPGEGEQQELERRYEARIEMIERFSDRQLRELKKQISGERKLDAATKRQYLDRIEHKLVQERVGQLAKKVDGCEGKNYILMKRVYEEIEHAQLPPEEKEPLLRRLEEWRLAQGEREVRQLVEKMPPTLDREGYRRYVERIRDYEEVDLSPYEEQLLERRRRAEEQELANTVRRARKVSKEDYEELAAKLREGDFLPELAAPYLEKIEGKIRELDAEELARICPDPMKMSFEEGMVSYQMIQDGNFLPELRENALKMLEKRLAKLKTDECELLVQKLSSELAEAGISERVQHHFYPARRALLGQADPEELRVIDYAMASYAAGVGLFEYPILVVDATRGGTGKEGFILTPDHFYYSTLLSAYGFPIAGIDAVTASTGLLNRGLYVHRKNGTKIKVPCAVETKELTAFAQVLDNYIRYLQEKPESRQLPYLAKEKHDTICCLRCGHIYRGGTVCPECGFQSNE